MARDRKAATRNSNHAWVTAMNFEIMIKSCQNKSPASLVLTSLSNTELSQGRMLASSLILLIISALPFQIFSKKTSSSLKMFL